MAQQQTKTHNTASSTIQSAIDELHHAFPEATSNTKSSIDSTLEALDKQFPFSNGKRSLFSNDKYAGRNVNNYKSLERSRKKSYYEDKMDRQRLEHILFADNNENDPKNKQKERMRKKLQKNNSVSKRKAPKQTSTLPNHKNKQKDKAVSKRKGQKNDKNSKHAHERRIAQLQNESKKQKRKMNEYVRDKQILKKRLDESVKALAKIKQQNQTLKLRIRNERDQKDNIQKLNLKQQNEINQLKRDMEILGGELQKTTQANMRQEQKHDDDDQENGLSHAQVLNDLNSQIEDFKQNYNKNKLQQIYDGSPQELKQNHINIINEYNDTTRSIILSATTFINYINDIQLFINKLSIPNVNQYKTWNLEQIMSWIATLDNGKYIQYNTQLRQGFIQSNILNGELLPELTRADLSNPPFNINDFVVKRDLETHFKSLGQMNGMIYDGNEIEGAQTKYIQQ